MGKIRLRKCGKVIKINRGKNYNKILDIYPSSRAYKEKDCDMANTIRDSKLIRRVKKKLARGIQSQIKSPHQIFFVTKTTTTAAATTTIIIGGEETSLLL